MKLVKENYKSNALTRDENELQLEGNEFQK